MEAVRDSERRSKITKARGVEAGSKRALAIKKSPIRPTKKGS